MKNNTLKRLTTYYVGGREFYIVIGKSATVCGVEKKIWGIETKYFDEDGHLTQEINGCLGHLSATVPECIENITKDVELDAFIEEFKKETGKTDMDALEAYYIQKMARQ